MGSKTTTAAAVAIGAAVGGGEEAGAETSDPANLEAVRVEANGGALFDALHHGPQRDHLTRASHTAWYTAGGGSGSGGGGGVLVKGDHGQTTTSG